jgi:uncharacterized protein (UPF0264 family)
VTVTPGLLVSVRSTAEAEAALAGGAALIDIKEPARGPLGRADDTTIAAIARLVAGRRPVSAALGELTGEKGTRTDSLKTVRVPFLDFVKVGLARARRVAWQDVLSRHLDDGHGPGQMPQLVLCAYADWTLADAPPLDEVLRFACSRAGNVFLIDTFDKTSCDGRPRSLLDWVPMAHIIDICRACRANGVRIALAGSLASAEIAALEDARPDWFAVRGAVCADGRRDAAVSVDKVRALAEQVKSQRTLHATHEAS